MVVTFRFGLAVGYLIVACLIQAMGLIQDQGVIPPFRDADPVLRSRNGSKVADKQQVLFAGLTAADETEDAAVSVIGIDPLKSVPVVVKAVHGRILFVYVKQIFKIFM